ncbi:hypothetical protein M5W87_14530 [Paenibacillus apiarius]|uniref:Uncharacterized protein n=1 Tax=Paenibacillus apiarius TaxID=46240 RepID=A0ABT4DX55_9BACL|nr:hypothetical protein [Paenibacillus apiarius]MCY9516836.1 hypothetical protein [Paenibacillus apiarius]MCY9521929.1 hypothetical protein [Paenibacillus apiarius]MCY9550475.1 hypothetical protein [Paenibacillus apiarius]MCY9559876.1 hypothetical protein [Paenibacillus apiarius]MCY9683440.1 hypothetical protein [Paenibacillus apiarius]
MLQEVLIKQGTVFFTADQLTSAHLSEFFHARIEVRFTVFLTARHGDQTPDGQRDNQP